MAKKWSQMTKTERRIAVAKDVLAQIKAKKFAVQTGIYIEIERKEPEETGEVSLQALLGLAPQKSLPTITCTVCAKGALLVSKCRLNGDSVLSGSFYDFVAIGKEVDEELRSLFGKKQADLIEMYFEGRDIGKSNCFEDYEKKCSEDDEKLAYNFYLRHENNEDRLIVIMKNIIENKGTFVPE